jgi:hypothetical protein
LDSEQHRRCFTDKEITMPIDQQSVTPKTTPTPISRVLPKIAEGTKISRIVALLERQDGASITDMVDVTGWLPHTTRAALTGLRHKGYDIAKTKCDGVAVYSLTPGAPL